MKANKLLFAALLVLLLLLVMAPAAFADSIYPAPGPVEAGSSLNHLLATVAADTPVSAAEGPTASTWRWRPTGRKEMSICAARP